MKRSGYADWFWNRLTKSSRMQRVWPATLTGAGRSFTGYSGQ